MITGGGGGDLWVLADEIQRPLVSDGGHALTLRTVVTFGE
jgi:hypothetical protein